MSIGRLVTFLVKNLTVNLAHRLVCLDHLLWNHKAFTTIFIWFQVSDWFLVFFIIIKVAQDWSYLYLLLQTVLAAVGITSWGQNANNFSMPHTFRQTMFNQQQRIFIKFCLQKTQTEFCYRMENIYLWPQTRCSIVQIP